MLAEIQQVFSNLFASEVDVLSLVVIVLVVVALLDKKRTRRPSTSSSCGRVEDIYQSPRLSENRPVQTRRSSRAVSGRQSDVFVAVAAMENICGLHDDGNYSGVVDAWKEFTARKMIFQNAIWSKKYTSRQFYSAVLEAHLQQEKPDAMYEMVQHLRTSGFATATLQTYEDLMRKCAQYKQYTLARKVVDMIYEDNMTPRPVTLSCVVSFALTEGEVTTARKFFDMLLETNDLSMRSLMSGMQVYHAQKDEAAAEALLARLPEWGLEVDHLLLNAAICISVQGGNFEQGEKLLKLYSVKDDEDSRLSIRALRRFGPTNQLVGWMKSGRGNARRRGFSA